MIKSLIFDYGGTLDTDGLHWSHVLWEAYTRTAAQLPQARGLGEITWEAFRAAYVYGEFLFIYEFRLHIFSFL